MDFENWLMFCSLALLATATPGPAALLVSINSLSFGFKKSLYTVAGNITGLFIMSGFSVLGLSAIVMHSTAAFMLIKVCGAVYLAYLGIKLWRNGVAGVDASTAKRNSKGSLNLYVQGVLVAITNPKAVVFTTALFPQFINPEQALLPQFSVLVFSFMGLSVLCLSTYALGAQKAKYKTKRWLSGRLMGRLFGGTFICAGCVLVSSSK